MVVLSLLQSACQVVSDRPVLPISDAVAALGDAFVAAGVDKSGALVNDKGEAMAVETVYENGIYRVVAPSDGSWLSFHRIDGAQFDYLIQFHTPKQTSYLVARGTPGEVRVMNVSLDQSNLAELAKRGIVLAAADMNRKVASERELRETISVWAAANHVKLLDNKNYDMRFLVAESAADRKALVERVIADRCLATAGHPADQAVKALPGKLSSGVDMARIDVAKAEELCGWAVAPDAPASARYALARVHSRKGEYAKAQPIIDDLMTAGFDLAFLMRADDMVRGNGRPADPSAARKLLESRADSPVIQFFLGQYLYYGEFGQPDPVAAAGLFEKSARGGFAHAYYGLGLLHENGAGMEKNEKRAFEYYSAAAAAGDRFGNYASGRAYYFGSGVTENRAEAFKLLKLAADRDVVDAQYFVGFMSAQGQGTAKSESTAIGWLQKASDAGHVAAKAELGRMVYLGLGVTADREKGRKLLEEASAAGDKTARGYLDNLTKPATPRVDTSIPDSIRSDIEKLAGDQPFQLNQVNMPFMAGMAQQLAEKCGVPRKLEDRLELAALAANGSSFILGGNDYSNPDLGKTMSNMLGNTALLAAGIKFAEQVPCDSPLAETLADGLVEASRSNKTASGGGEGPFVSSCTPAFDRTRCACLAQIGRGAMPDIYQRHYDRSIIKEIISRNPLLGLTIAMTCQIGNY